MLKQPALPGLRDAMKKKRTRREQFLAEMDAVVPWGRLLPLIASHYPKVGPKGGRPPMPLETILRVYFLQNWYALGDPMAEETLYDSEAMRRFTGIELGDDHSRRDHDPQFPSPSGAARADRSDLRRRERAPGRQGDHAALGHAGGCEQAKAIGSSELRKIIDAPSSTKNKAGARDPEMSSTKKGNDSYFGMKAHIGVDADSGTAHSLETSTAKVHDSQVWDALLHGEETSVWAHKGYVSAGREAAFAGLGKACGVMRKAPKGGALHLVDERANRIIAMVRAKVEHPFRMFKRQFGHKKTRYRDLAKNRAQLFTLFALGNLFLVRRKLTA